MKSVLFSAVVVSAVFMGAFAQASDTQYDAKYFTIGQVKIERLDVSTQGTGSVGIPAPTPSDAPTGDVDLGNIINLGKKLWDIIVANKPVVNISTDMATALPSGVKGWDQLATWQMPTVREYRVTYTNLYGMNMVDFKFRVLYTHGGSVNGKGQYLTNATIIPAHLTVGWGYTFNAQSTVAGVMNAGTATDPVAAMQLQLHWSIDTVLKHEENSVNYYIKGDGSFKALGSLGEEIL
ncbi:MAG: hypothetical protein HY074_02845 [Deltaproteobacteria bacterium]|nr:hypothetical protein [Deltaproteobacteria bacterium]